MYRTLSLPSASRTSFMARIEPNASPSGFSCETRRKRSFARIASATASSSLIGREVVDQLAHTDALLHASIVFEGQLRSPLHSELPGNLRLEDAVSRLEPLQRLGALLLVA